MNDEIIRIEKVDPELKKQIKLEAIKQDKTMREFIIDTMQEKINKYVCKDKK